MKTCKKCKEPKPDTAFYKDAAKAGGLTSFCGDCIKTRVKKYRRDNLAKVRAQQKERHKENPEPARQRASTWHMRNHARHIAYMAVRRKNNPRAIKSQRLKAAFGITLEQYEEMLESQGGVCAICYRPPEANSRSKKQLAVDHCHKTGAIRGLLCANCNNALGLFKDSHLILFSEQYYLQSKLVHPIQLLRT